MNKNIAHKEYKTLSIQISLNGLSFYSLDTLDLQTTPLTTKEFVKDTNFTLESQLEKIFFDDPIFEIDFDHVKILIDSNLYTPVPSTLFDKNNINEYLKFSTKSLPIDNYDFDIIENHTIHNVYITNDTIVSVCNAFFENITYQHATSVLIKRLLDLSKNSYEVQFFVHVQKTHFEIVVINRGKLLLINSFEYTTQEDFLYYILFVAEQLELNPEKFQLFFLGIIKPNDDLYTITYKYVRHVYLLDEGSCNPKNYNFSYSSCLKNFILVNS